MTLNCNDTVLPADSNKEITATKDNQRINIVDLHRNYRKAKIINEEMNRIEIRQHEDINEDTDYRFR